MLWGDLIFNLLSGSLVKLFVGVMVLFKGRRLVFDVVVIFGWFDYKVGFRDLIVLFVGLYFGLNLKIVYKISC